jgi:hypothetical protein
MTPRVFTTIRGGSRIGDNASAGGPHGAVSRRSQTSNSYLGEAGGMLVTRSLAGTQVDPPR